MSNFTPDTRQAFMDVAEQYCDSPTSSNRSKLYEAADVYRDAWIDARSAPATVAAGAETPDDASTRYKRVLSVAGTQPDGTELMLSLQSRTSRREGRTWYVVSWRTRLSPGGHNRRFYRTDGKLWTLPIAVARDLLERLEKEGGLDSKYDDLHRRPDFRVRVVSGASVTGDAALLHEVTLPDEDWGASPLLVVLDDPNSNWRKIMLVNRETGIATFRSTTTDAEYMPRVAMRPGSPWFLDNSMQDVNVQQARALLEQLRKAR